MSAFTSYVMAGQYKHERVSGTCPLTLPTDISCEIPELIIHGKSIQNGTPADGAPVTITSAGNEYLHGLGESPIYIPTLRSVGDVTDVYDVKAGKITRKVVEVTIDGVNVSVTTGDSNSKKYFTLKIKELPGFANGLTSVISTHFITEYASADGRIYMAGLSGQKVALFFSWDQTLDTAEKMNNWLKAQYDTGNPVKIIYVLTEPVIEDAPAYSPIQKSGGTIITDSGKAAGVTIDAAYLKHA